MNNFLVTYASGLKAEIRSGLESVELFCNEHFGSTWGVAKENGAVIDMVSADDAVAVEIVEVQVEVVDVIPSIPMTPTEPTEAIEHRDLGGVAAGAMPAEPVAK